MKTAVKTNIKGNENLTVQQSVMEIFDELNKKGQFILLNIISHDEKKSLVAIRKSRIIMLKESI